MSRVSIIIPVVGDLQGLEDTLISVLENRPARSQIVVALGCPYDDPYDLAGEIDFVHAPERAKLAAVLNTAVAACAAPLLHVLSCGVQATAGWTDAALPLFGDPEVAAVVPLVLRKDDPQRIVAAGLAYCPGGAVRRVAAGKTLETAFTKTAEPHGPDALAGFYRKSALEAVGGFDTTVADDLVAADTALLLRAAGFRCALQSLCRVYAERARGPAVGAFRRGFQAERFFWRWAAANGRIRSLTHHMLSVGVELMQCPLRPSKGIEFIGRVLALVWCGAGATKRPTIPPLPELQRERASRPHFAPRSELPIRSDAAPAVASSSRAGAA